LLKEVYLDALKSREQKISKITDSSYQRILAEASLRWIAYEPSPAKCESAGIDSSWNKRAFQGLNLYVVDAVAVTSANKILAARHDCDIAESARQEMLESKAMAMEAAMICIDGSLMSRLTKSALDMASGMIRQYGSAIFVSKSSESRSQFSSLGSRAGDIYYYGHAGKSAGFSMPIEVQSRDPRVFETYARLLEHTPIVRIEIIGAAGEQEVKRMLDMLRYHSVTGYPYCLKLAHDNCKISNEDIDRLASIFSLQHEQGARDALNE
jgi:hypothetical protein